MKEMKDSAPVREAASADPDTALVVDGVTKIYRLYDKPADRLKEALGLSKKKLHRELYALNDVSFTVRRGETVGIIGTNGSGKSTILKIITGVLNPTRGSVRVNGRISALLELGAGFNMEYSGLENIYLNGTMMGFTREEVDARLNDILDFADIGDFVHQPCKTYSSGMFVRLAFAVAINIDPEILIVDEALSVGDVFFQAKCYRKFEEFKKQGRTILFVSHDLSSIAKYCDRVVLLNKGVKRAEGGAHEMVDLYKQLLVNLDSADEEKAEGEEPAAEGEKAQEKEAGSAAFSENEAAAGDPLTGQLERNPNTLEYGEKQAEFVKVRILDANGLETGSIEKGTEFTISATVRFNAPIDDPIVAYSFKNLQGTEITGTNTWYEENPPGHQDAGNEVTVTFRQRMTLQGGEYLLSMGCTGYHDGAFRVFHRLYDLINITVISTKNTVGFYDMESEVEVVQS